jgi:translocation and assembly module TamB
MSSRKLSIKKLVLIGLPLSLLVLVSVTSIWMLASQSGSNWLWHQLESSASGSLQASRVEGDLATGFVIHGLKFHTQGTEIGVARVDISARPGVWPLSIQVQKLLLQNVTILSRTSADSLDTDIGQVDPGSIIEAMSLPLPLEIQHVELTDITFQENDDASVVLADALKFNLKLDEQLVIGQLVYSSPVVAATGQARLGFEPPYDLAVSLEAQVEKESEQAFRLPFVFEGSGNLHQLQFRLRSNPMGLDLGGELLDPLNEPGWDITGVLQQLPQTIDVAG